MFSFQSVLGKGEKLLWQGQPPTGILLNKSDALLVPFSLLWAGFAVFWNVGVWATDAPVYFRAFGLPFLLVGAYITIGRFLVDGYRRKRTRYGVTNQRILIATGMGQSVKSLDIGNLPALILDESLDGSGTISFTYPLGDNLRPNFPLDVSSAPQFRRIDKARSVYEIIRKAQKTPQPFDQGATGFAPMAADYSGFQAQDER